MTGNLRCPECGSHNTNRSHTRSRWEGWRQRVSGKRLYRCRVCHWRGWSLSHGGRRSAADAVVPDPPCLPGQDRGTDVDLAALDAVVLAPEKRTKPLAGAHRV